jgi:hypothetical protein
MRLNRRGRRRGKGNRATLAEGDEVVLTRAGLKELAGHLHDTSGLAEIICYRGAGDVEIRFKGKRTKWSTMSPKWVGTGSVKLSAAQREQRAALAVKDKAQRALMRVYKKRGAFDFFDHLRAGAVRIGKGILRHEESGYEVGIERIGKGHASEAFLAADGWVYVFTNEDARDPAKEVLSDAVDRHRTWRGRQPPLLRHLPNIEAVGFGSTARRHGFVWRMPKYSPARGHAGKHGRILAALYRESRGPIHLDFVQRVKAAHKARKIPKALAAAVEELAQRTLDYNGEWAFEFPPRNLMQDDKGNLVLLDVIYDREAVMRRGRAQLSPKSQIRRVGGRAAIAFTNIRTDRLYCICPITDGKLYVDVPDTDHLLRLLATRRWRSTAHLHTIGGYVPYFGGAIAFHAEKLLLKGVKPHWFVRASTRRRGWTHQAAWRRHLEARRQVIEDGLYADEREADQFHSGYAGECEWEGPSGLRFGPEDIADVYAASLDLRSKRGRLLKKLVPGVLVKKGLPQQVGRPCR